MKRQRSFRAIAISLSLVLSLVACEIGLRVIHELRRQQGSATVQDIALDDHLGWRATENFKDSGWLRDACDNEYFADVRTDANGFRVFGNPDQKLKRRLLVIGDSFTHALQVSSDKAYYSLLGARIDTEVFAYGVGGFGTLQEYLALGDHLDLVQPDALLIQFCSNDLINNHFELEMRSFYNNNGLLRPYIAGDGDIVYRVPKRPPGLRRIAARHSRFLYFVFSRIDLIFSQHSGVSVEDTIADVGLRDPDYSRAVEITGDLLRMVRADVPSEIPIFSFCVDEAQPSYDILAALSRSHSISFIDDVPKAIRTAEERGECTRAADGGHWNERGHELAASVLVDSLQKHWKPLVEISAEITTPRAEAASRPPP